jgi:hypothetical protein
LIGQRFQDLQQTRHRVSTNGNRTLSPRLDYRMIVTFGGKANRWHPRVMGSLPQNDAAQNAKALHFWLIAPRIDQHGQKVGRSGPVEFQTTKPKWL